MEISGIVDALRELLYFHRVFHMHTRAEQHNTVWKVLVSARLKLYKVAGKWQLHFWKLLESQYLFSSLSRAKEKRKASLWNIKKKNQKSWNVLCRSLLKYFFLATDEESQAQKPQFSHSITGLGQLFRWSDKLGYPKSPSLKSQKAMTVSWQTRGKFRYYVPSGLH